MSFTQPKIELVRCPHCGDDAEVWSDEADGKCAKCGKPVCRTTTQSCIDWCKYAKECLGVDEHKRYQDMKTRLRKESLLKAGESRLADEAQKQLARTRATFAEQILGRETAGDPNVVIAAAALLSVPEPDSAVSDILHELGYPEGFIKEVTGIVTHLREPGADESLNFRIVYDADLLTRAMTTRQTATPTRFLTTTGKVLAPA